MCQNYTLTLNRLNDKYKGKKIAFYGVFAGRTTDAAELKTFARTYKINFELFLDEKKNLANCLGAKITPEVFLVSAENEILYKGSIDNWLIEPGQKRNNITEHYLEDALQEISTGNEVKIKAAQAKGCLIE
jgi:hypothetical protein